MCSVSIRFSILVHGCYPNVSSDLPKRPLSLATAPGWKAGLLCGSGALGAPGTASPSTCWSWFQKGKCLESWKMLIADNSRPSELGEHPSGNGKDSTHRKGDHSPSDHWKIVDGWSFRILKHDPAWKYSIYSDVFWEPLFGIANRGGGRAFHVRKF